MPARAFATVLAALALLGASVLIATATAAAPPEFLVQFGENGSGAGQTRVPSGMAVDPTSGHLYVNESSNNRISEFTAWGQFVKAWGSGVQDGKIEAQVCTAATGCRAGNGAGLAGELNGSGGIALDSSGDLYVAESAFDNARVQKFSPSGESLLLFGGDVTASGPGNTGANEQQTVTVKGTGGKFPLRVQTGAIVGNLTAGSNVITEVHTTFGSYHPGDLLLGEGLPFSNALGGANGARITAVGADTITLAQAATGGEVRALRVEENTGAIGTGARAAGSTTVTAAEALSGTFAVGQRISGTGIPAGTTIEALGAGTLTLSNAATAASSGTLTASDIPYNATEGEVLGALETLPGIGVGDIEVSGGPVSATESKYTLTFDGGPFAGNDIATLLSASGGLDGTKSVSVTTPTPGGGGEVCVPANGDVCQRGVSGPGNGQFSDPEGIAADPATDTIYVGDSNRIEEFEADGSYKGQIALPGVGQVTALARDQSGNLYVAGSGLGDNVRKVDGSGATLNTISTPKPPRALATDAAGNLYSVGEFQISFNEVESEISEFDENGVEIGRFGTDEFTRPRGIATNSVGDVYVANTIFSPSYIRAYGPEPNAIEPPPSVAPDIEGQYATEVDTEEATVKATISPHFWSTQYYVQYGPGDCSVNPCAEQPAAPGTTLAELRGETDVVVTIGGLTPGTTYHYRFVADSAGGGPTFGPDLTFYTPLVTPVGLPDGRVYEMVSPPDKNGAEVGVPNVAGGGSSPFFSVAPQQAAPDGEAMSYHSFTSFGDPEGAPAASEYLSRRGPGGWSTENINPRFEEGYLRDPIVGFSEDLAHAAVIAFQRAGQPPLAAPAPPGNTFNLFVRDNVSGELRTLTTAEPEFPAQESYCLSFGGASEDYSHVFFTAKGTLTPDAPIATNSQPNLYEWSAATGVTLAGVLPDGTPAPPGGQATGFGRGTEIQCNTSGILQRHAVSADGSRAVWTYQGLYAGPNGNAILPLFDRIDGAETVQLDAPNQGVAGAGGGGVYWDASTNGRKVFFTDDNALTSDSTAENNRPDLYLYDFDAPQGERLEDLTANSAEPASVQGVVGASEDGSYAYFVANGVLSAEANARNEVASPGQPNLYAWHQGEGIRFIAALDTGDRNDWGTDPRDQTARVTPDGRHLAFLSLRSLTGYDNTIAGYSGCAVVNADSSEPSGDPRCKEAFVYDYESEDLVCASCNPSGARPIGPPTTTNGMTNLPGWSTPYSQPRYLSDDGSRLFFETRDALSLKDTNGKQDVYEFERPGVGSCDESSPTYSPAANGCVSLVSTGSSDDDSYLLDASADGRDVFIGTRQPLVPEDKGTEFDVYDARVGGRAPVPPVPACEGEACRGAPSTATGVPSPGTSAFEGPANPKPKHGCPKGRRQVHRKGRTRCVSAHKRHPHRTRAHKGKHRRADSDRRAAK